MQRHIITAPIRLFCPRILQLRLTAPPTWRLIEKTEHCHILGDVRSAFPVIQPFACQRAIANTRKQHAQRERSAHIHRNNVHRRNPQHSKDSAQNANIVNVVPVYLR